MSPIESPALVTRCLVDFATAAKEDLFEADRLERRRPDTEVERDREDPGFPPPDDPLLRPAVERDLEREAPDPFREPVVVRPFARGVDRPLLLDEVLVCCAIGFLPLDR
jgi:hypothetical protein